MLFGTKIKINFYVRIFFLNFTNKLLTTTVSQKSRKILFFYPNTLNHLKFIDVLEIKMFVLEIEEILLIFIKTTAFLSYFKTSPLT